MNNLITTLSKETPIHFDIPDGDIVIIGERNKCANIGLRYQKHHSNYLNTIHSDYSDPLPSTGSESNIIKWGGDLSSPDLNIKSAIYIIVSDDFIKSQELSKSLHNVVILSSENTEGYSSDHHMLRETDWMVIRELEKMFLLGTDLNHQRNYYRDCIDEGYVSNYEPVPTPALESFKEHQSNNDEIVEAVLTHKYKERYV